MAAAILLEQALPRLAGIPLLSLAAPVLWSFLCLREKHEWPCFLILFASVTYILPLLSPIDDVLAGFVAIQAAEAFAIALLIKHMIPPSRAAASEVNLIAYVATLAFVTFIGAILATVLAGSRGLLLVWWLRDLCGFVALAGPLWYLVSRKAEGVAADLGGRQALPSLLGLSVLLLGLLLLVSHLQTLGGMGALHHDLKLAVLLAPIPVAVVLTDCFLGLGAAVAMTLIAPMMIDMAARAGANGGEVLPVLLFTYVYLTLLSITLFLVSSRRRQLRLALAQTEHAMRTQERFVARMSHDLRTPLNAILGFSELQREHCHCPNGQGYGSNIHASGQRLMAMIEGAIEHGIGGSLGDGARISRHSSPHRRHRRPA